MRRGIEERVWREGLRRRYLAVKQSRYEQS